MDTQAVVSVPGRPPAPVALDEATINFIILAAEWAVKKQREFDLRRDTGQAS